MAVDKRITGIEGPITETEESVDIQTPDMLVIVMMQVEQKKRKLF